ncbi:arylsulfatase [Haloferula chungangensis]|uniref:Arylsulfatase n=1 Tax=Haloferula chungangensis TaxID=1048331 RepID=A0ABW2L3I6_9BACT
MKPALFLSIAFLLATPLLASQPNIVFVFVDDMGYSDIGCFGGEIDTPRIDSLADAGLRLSNFRVTPMCVTSRASLISGMEYSAAGFGNVSNGLSFAHLLRDAGYHTSITGKVHAFGNLSTGNPNTDYGFDRFFGFRDGATNNFKGDDTWRLDNADFNNFPPGFYATDAITDYTIDFIDQALSQGKPFFSWVCYNAPHGPHQAFEADIRKYYDTEVYAAGWDQLRRERFERQKAMGLVPADMVLAETGAEVPEWNSLPETSTDEWVRQKDFEALCMSAYAGMVDSVDQNVGRIIDHLSDPDGDPMTDDSVLENTLIIFCSDNGGSYAGQWTDRSALPWDPNSNVRFNTGYGWGVLQNTPFRSYKHSSYGGGVRSPFVAHWPDGISLPAGTILHQASNLWDFYPTFLELAGATYPASYAGKSTKPLMGESIVPLFTNASSTAGSDFFISHFTDRSKGLFDDGWKIVRYFDGPWELYNFDADPGEHHDLAGVRPDLRDVMVAQWDAHFAINPPSGGNGSVWNLPPGTEHRGWGFDNIRTGLVSSVPEYMSGGVPTDTPLTLTFVGAIDFNGTEGKKIRLQRFGNPEILWEADPDTSHPAQGSNTITFTDFPELEPDAHYYITWDTGWARYRDGNLKNINAVLESAFAYRFKTASSYGNELEKTLTVPPGGTALPEDDNTGNGVPDLLDHLLGAGMDSVEPRIRTGFDQTTNPPTPLLTFSGRNASSGSTLGIEYSPDLVTPFTPLFSINGSNHNPVGGTVTQFFERTGDDRTDYTLRLDPSAFPDGHGFFRAAGTIAGEVPLSIWTFRESSFSPVTLSTLATSQDATINGANSGIISSAGSFTFDDPVVAWSGAQLPASGISNQLRTAITATTDIEVTRITYTGYLWSDRPSGATTTVQADVVAFLNGSLDSPGVVSPNKTLVTGNGGKRITPFEISHPINGKTLNATDNWELRLRLEDDNGAAYSLGNPGDQEGFGIDTVLIYGKALP